MCWQSLMVVAAQKAAYTLEMGLCAVKTGYLSADDGFVGTAWFRLLPQSVLDDLVALGWRYDGRFEVDGVGLCERFSWEHVRRCHQGAEGEGEWLGKALAEALTPSSREKRARWWRGELEPDLSKGMWWAARWKRRKQAKARLNSSRCDG